MQHRQRGDERMNWLHQIETERQRLQPGENPGRTRTIARRIAGIALQQYFQSFAGDFLAVLRTAAADETLPGDIREASERLMTRLDPNFISPSTDPVSDAMLIVDFVRQQRA
jgi:hypothetical protein